jgi:hypothetical protein
MVWIKALAELNELPGTEGTKEWQARFTTSETLCRSI